MEAVVLPTESHSLPLVHSSLLVSVLCQESSVWLKAFGFCYTITDGLLLGLLLDILLLSCVMGIMIFFVSVGLSPHMFQQFIDLGGVGVGQLIALALGLGAGELTQRA